MYHRFGRLMVILSREPIGLAAYYAHTTRRHTFAALVPGDWRRLPRVTRTTHLHIYYAGPVTIGRTDLDCDFDPAKEVRR